MHFQQHQSRKGRSSKRRKSAKALSHAEPLAVTNQSMHPPAASRAYSTSKGAYESTLSSSMGRTSSICSNLPISTSQQRKAAETDRAQGKKDLICGAVRRSCSDLEEHHKQSPPSSRRPCGPCKHLSIYIYRCRCRVLGFSRHYVQKLRGKFMKLHFKE